MVAVSLAHPSLLSSLFSMNSRPSLCLSLSTPTLPLPLFEGGQMDYGSC